MKISRRNFLAVAGAAAAAAALTACGGSSASSTSTASSAAASTASSAAEGGEKIVKVALTCDTGTIDDESFNQACWTAVSGYMGDDCQYYIPEADGGIYTSAVEAALKNNGYVIGVDVDQNYIGANGVADGTYAYNPFITSAMKGLSEAVNTALSDIEAGDWSEIAASNGNFGLEDGDYIGLPTADDSWNFETFTKDEYETVKDKIKSGEITVDNNSDDATKPTVSEFTTVNYIQ